VKPPTLLLFTVDQLMKKVTNSLDCVIHHSLLDSVKIVLHLDFITLSFGPISSCYLSGKFFLAGRTVLNEFSLCLLSTVFNITKLINFSGMILSSEMFGFIAPAVSENKSENNHLSYFLKEISSSSWTNLM
jgi:hypothetical protein